MCLALIQHRQVSFGSEIWPMIPEMVWAFTDTMLDLKIPFVRVQCLVDVRAITDKSTPDHFIRFAACPCPRGSDQEVGRVGTRLPLKVASSADHFEARGICRP